MLLDRAHVRTTLLLISALIGCDSGGASGSDMAASAGQCLSHSTYLDCSSSPCCDRCQTADDGQSCTPGPACAYSLAAIHPECMAICGSDGKWFFTCPQTGGICHLSQGDVPCRVGEFCVNPDYTSTPDGSLDIYAECVATSASCGSSCSCFTTDPCAQLHYVVPQRCDHVSDHVVYCK